MKRHGRPHRTSVGYIPLDELLEAPYVRILRLLARLDWLTSGDVASELGLAAGAERNAYQKHLERAVKAGDLTARRTVGLTAWCLVREHAITPYGRETLSRLLKRSELPVPAEDACVTCLDRRAMAVGVECGDCWRMRFEKRRSA